MHRIDGPTRSAELPAPSAAGTGPASPGWFGHGDPATGTPATTLDVDWANTVQEELAAPIEAEGMVLDKGNRGQLLAAMDARYVRTAPASGGGGGDAGGGTTGSGINAASGEFAFAGGGFCKVGRQNGQFGEGQVAVNFVTPFPTACLSLQLTAIDANASALRDFTMQIVSISPGGFVAMVQKNGSDGSNIDGFIWDAKGY